MHPRVHEEILRRVEEQRETDNVVVLDIPLLVESGWPGLVGTVVVDLDPDTAVERLVRHRNFSEDDARARAQERLDASLTRLREAGVRARGEIGDGDPLQAIEDALRTFGPDLIVISTHPPGRSNWLEHGVVTSARERFAVPITHVVVDLEAEAVPD